MASTATLSVSSTKSRGVDAWFIFLMVGAGLLLRLRLAWLTFLNPDEALHYFLAHQPSLRLAYKASLTTAHPPLMILFLHYWAGLGSSEFLLRIPFVIAGTLFCWVMFLWVEKVASRSAAWFTLALFLFVPSLISLSAEIRQYSLLLLFCACCLYSLERGLVENFVKWMALSSAALYLALLTHYSALIFAAAVAIYACLRLFQTKLKKSAIAAWFIGQIGAAAIVVFLLFTQLSKLRQSGLPTEIAATWLRTSIFHRGQDQLVVFAWTRTLRLFRYFFSHGTIGAVALLLFLFALAVLLWPDERGGTRRGPSVAFLLTLSFVIALATAMAGIYPYGGTRHDVILALFAIPGVAIGLDRLQIGRVIPWPWLKPLLVGAALVIGNLFPSPTGPFIHPRNQNRELMAQAMSSLRSLPPNSVLLTDAQGSMVLNYYLCGEGMALPFSPGAEPLLKFRRGDYYVLVSNAQTGFDRARFPDLMAKTWQAVPRAATLYLFQSGWIDDKQQAWLAELRTLGGDPKNFGPNILVCPIGRADAAILNTTH